MPFPDDPFKTCGIEPFRFPATAQPRGEEGAYSEESNLRAIEDYLQRLLEAVCQDLTDIKENCCE